MILAVDIGNTTIALGVLDRGRVRGIARIDTYAKKKMLVNKLTSAVDSLTKEHRRKTIDQVAICSVVPAVLNIVAETIEQSLGIRPVIIGKDLKVPMKNRYRHPKQVGQDRLVGAYAASRLYGTPVIIIDLGTAITFDVVSPRGEYLGGSIVPGIRLSAESLYTKTALLPKIEIKAPTKIIGTTTEESILSGLFFGYGALCRGMIEQIAIQIKGKPKVVMTGGHTHLMEQFIDHKVRVIDDHLVFKGLDLLLRPSRN